MGSLIRGIIKVIVVIIIVIVLIYGGWVIFGLYGWVGVAAYVGTLVIGEMVGPSLLDWCASFLSTAYNDIVVGVKQVGKAVAEIVRKAAIWVAKTLGMAVKELGKSLGLNDLFWLAALGGTAYVLMQDKDEDESPTSDPNYSQRRVT